MRRFVWIIALLLLTARIVSAASSAETRAYGMAASLFQDKHYAAAERSLVDFMARYPNSQYTPEGVLYLGTSRFYLKNYAGAIEALEKKLPAAGPLGDKYLFWIAQSQAQSGQPAAALERYTMLIRDYPQSEFLLAAAFHQAQALAQSGQTDQLIALLGNPEGAFQKAAALKPTELFAVQGQLLLAETLFQKKQFEVCEKILLALGEKNLSAEDRWRQLSLLARTQRAAQHWPAAITTSLSLTNAAAKMNQPRLLAESVEALAEALEKNGQVSESLQALEGNLTDATPPEIRRRALFKMVDLALARQKTDEAMTRLDRFVVQNPDDPALDIALFTLGELRLKEFYSGLALGKTNDPLAVLSTSSALALAFTNFDQVITRFPQSEFLGKAHLNRGWCFWTLGNIPSAESDFETATVRLPLSQDQAVAFYKLADTQFARTNYAGAVGNYWRVIRQFGSFPAITNTLYDQALYQIVRAGLAGGDAVSATEAMDKILRWYPNTSFADRSALLVGQDLNRQGSTTEARELLQNFIRRAPDSALLPEVKLALARTFLQERRWVPAITTLEQWLLVHSNHVLAADAELAHALAVWRSATSTNAFNLFTNFITRYPTNRLTPLAENWLGDYCYDNEEYLAAEQHYLQAVDKKLSPALDLACQSRLGAGRAAFQRQEYGQATRYLLDLINDTNTPPDFLEKSWFQLGDTYYRQFLDNPNKATNEFSQAITAFSKIVAQETNTLSALVPLAWGRLGECHFQWGNQFTNAAAYTNAIDAYQRVLNSPVVQLSARSQAKVGLGRVYEMLGAPDTAWDYYSQVFIIPHGEKYDVKWVKEAGLNAARLCESREHWEEAITVYNRLEAVLPALKSVLEKRVANARGKLDRN